MSFGAPIHHQQGQQSPFGAPHQTTAAVSNNASDASAGPVARSHSFPNLDTSLQSNDSSLASFLSPDLSQQASPVFGTPQSASPFTLGQSQAGSSLNTQHAFDGPSPWPNVATPEQPQLATSNQTIPQNGQLPQSVPFNTSMHATSPASPFLHQQQPPPSFTSPAGPIPQTAPVASFDSRDYFDPRPLSGSSGSRQSSDPFPQEGLAPAFSAVATETEMTPAQHTQSTSSQHHQQVSQEALRGERARASFAQIEALLASMRPAVMEGHNISPLSTPQANLLDQAWRQFGDYFLRAATISGRHRPSISVDGSEGQTSPDDSYDSMHSVKGERKRVLSVEGDAPPPPAKRPEASPNITTARRLTFGAADRSQAPHLPHTNSSPIITRPSQTHPLLTQSTPSSSSSDLTASFSSIQSAPSLPTSSTTFTNPLSATPAGNAVAAGLHLPFGAQLKPDQAAASTLLPHHTHTPLMPSPLAGSMLSSNSDPSQQPPSAIPTSAPLSGPSPHHSHEASGMSRQQDTHMSMPPPPMPAGGTSQQNGHSPDDVQFGAPTQGFSSQPKASYNAMIHSTPTSPQPRVMAGSYFDAMRQDPSTVVMSRQPPNPRIFNEGPINSLPASEPGTSFSPSTSGSIAPSATVQPSSTVSSSGHAHTKSWAFSSTDAGLTGFASPPSLDPPRSSDGINAAPSRRSTRPRANTIGALSSLSRPGSPSDMDESYLPAGAGSDQIPSELKEEMNSIFVDWLQDLCNDLDATDSKGEMIHQTLMAKKMQKLDDMGEYRPFKFRIQAFTNRFAEELVHRGLSEAQVPHKIVRVFLWNQPLVSRYNEEGKKAKSKGNHVWSIDARKVGEGKWHFRPFQRRIVLPQTRTAKVGVLWAWEARIWDPQVSSIKATFSSPNLPPWLSWKHSEASDRVTELSGTPPLDAAPAGEDVYLPIHVEASFTVQDTPSTVELDFELEITSSSSIASAASIAASVGRPTLQSRPASSGGNSNASFDVTMAGPSDPTPAFDQAPQQHPSFPSTSSQPPPPPPSSLEVVSASVPLAQKDALENSPLVHAFAQRQSLDQAEAQATVQAYIAPISLLEKESEVFGQGEGPLASALQARDSAVHALAYAGQQPTAPHIISDLTAQAQHADRMAKQVMSEAQANALQSLVLNGPSESTSVPASSNTLMDPGLYASRP